MKKTVNLFFLFLNPLDVEMLIHQYNDQGARFLVQDWIGVTIPTVTIFNREQVSISSHGIQHRY